VNLESVLSAKPQHVLRRERAADEIPQRGRFTPDDAAVRPRQSGVAAAPATVHHQPAAETEYLSFECLSAHVLVSRKGRREIGLSRHGSSQVQETRASRRALEPQPECAVCRSSAFQPLTNRTLSRRSSSTEPQTAKSSKWAFTFRNGIGWRIQRQVRRERISTVSDAAA
jgi:hypothetical protein